MTAIRRWTSFWALLLLVLSVAAADQASKAAIRAHLEVNTSLAPIPSLADFFTLTHTQNTGAAFSLLQGAAPLLAAPGVIAILVLLVLYRRWQGPRWPLLCAVGLEIGGTLGNMVDRLRLGYVVDFLHIHGLPIFNLADGAIVSGALAIAWLVWRQEQITPSDPPADEMSPNP